MNSVICEFPTSADFSGWNSAEIREIKSAMQLLPRVLLAVLIVARAWGQSDSASNPTTGSQQTAEPTQGLAQQAGPVKATSSGPSGESLEPTKISSAIYPTEARERKIDGEVVAAFLVSETGDIESTKMLKGNPLLAEAAQEAMKAWKFKPVTKDGKPVAVIARATFNFTGAPEQEKVSPKIDMPAEFPQRVKVAENVSDGFLLKHVSPEYPLFARQAKITGTVVLNVIINKEGKVADVTLISGPAVLSPSAIDAVRQWLYRPCLVMGRPVEVDTQVRVTFTLG